MLGNRLHLMVFRSKSPHSANACPDALLRERATVRGSQTGAWLRRATERANASHPPTAAFPVASLPREQTLAVGVRLLVTRPNP